MSEFKDKILMCPPDYFSVDYIINPWMAGHKEGLRLERARQQWDALRDAIAEFAEVVTMDAQPELPDERKARFMAELELPGYDAVILTSDRELADFFEETLALYTNAKKLSNWIMTELLRELRDKDQEIKQCLVTPEHLAKLLSLIDKGTIRRRNVFM